MREVRHDTYTVTVDAETSTIICTGSFRLHTPHYNKILETMKQATDNQTDTVTLDIRQLQFLNSSGINMMYKFVMNTRDGQSQNLVIKGSRQVPWQQKTLTNFTKLWPALQLDIE